jgi:hypothetical protein
MALRPAAPKHRPLRSAMPVPPRRSLVPLRMATPAAPHVTPAPTQGGGVPAPAPGVGGSDFSSDPILAQIRAMVQQNDAAAEASAGAARTQALIRFGFDPSMAGLYDKNTAAAAQGNPFSVLAQLAHNHQARARNLDENMNKSNLFYSSSRGQAIGEEGRQYLGEQSSAQSSLQDLFGQIQGGLLSAHQANQDRLSQGSQDAYQRALDFALKYGTGGSGGMGGSPLLRAAAGSRPTPARPRAGTVRAVRPRAIPRRYGQVE